jgi:hypothetical protein
VGLGFLRAAVFHGRIHKFDLSATVPSWAAGNYTLPLVVTMANEYRIRPHGPQFLIIDQTGETVGVHKTEREAKSEIDAYLRDDVMWTRLDCW